MVDAVAVVRLAAGAGVGGPSTAPYGSLGRGRLSSTPPIQKPLLPAPTVLMARAGLVPLPLAAEMALPAWGAEFEGG
jgi:hypothetical protein